MWVDRNVDSEENMIYRSCFGKLDFYNFKSLHNPEEFTEYVKNKLTKEKIYIISSG